MTVEHAAEDHEPERPSREHEDLVQPEHPTVLGVVELARVGGRTRSPGVHVDDHRVFLARAPERVVVLVGVAAESRRQRHRGQHHAAEQSHVARAHAISSTARLMSCRSIGMHPARRPGAAAQKSTSHRLYACIAGHTGFEAFGLVRPEEHRIRQAAGEHGARVGHLGVHALLLEHRKALAFAVAGDEPSPCCSSQPVLRGVSVDTHSGEPTRRHRPHGVGLVDLASVGPPEHRDGRGRQLAQRAHGLPIGGIDVREEVVEIVGRGVRIGRHDDIGLSRAIHICAVIGHVHYSSHPNQAGCSSPNCRCARRRAHSAFSPGPEPRRRI